MIFCIQCSMKAMVEGQPYTPSETTIEEHMAKWHSDLEVTKKERIELEKKLAKVMSQ